MKIDASRYTLFWQNPERYRIRECWKLAPKEPSAGTFASLLTFGRRRGTCFHELRDAQFRGISRAQAIQELKDGGFGDKEIEVASRMADFANDQYLDEKYLAHEVFFEKPIEGTLHSMVGRIDGIVESPDGEVYITDWKTSKYRPKDELARKGESYCRGHQVGFYLVGSRHLGLTPTRFEYRLVSNQRKGDGVSISRFNTERTPRQLRQLEADVALTCDLILWLKKTKGLESPWPSMPETFKTGYEELEGSKLYQDWIPDGFEPKIEHLPVSMEVV